MSPLKISVVLCTFNGERFLPEQLASLRAQTRLPDELLAQDDGSSDATLSLLDAEKARAPYACHVSRNPNRLGFAANFASALARAEGDILFFCDQDDVWEKEKIEILLRKFEEDPALQIACSEASLIRSDGAPLPGLVLDGNGLSSAARAEWGRRDALPFLLRRNPVPGMTIAIRRTYRDRLLPLPAGWEHDYWALLVAASLGEPILVEPRPLVRYRQHESQVIGGQRSFLDRWRRAESSPLSQRVQESARWALLELRLRDLGALPKALDLAAGKRMHLSRRGAFSSWKLLRTMQIGLELLRGGYHRFDAGVSSAVKDLLSS